MTARTIRTMNTTAGFPLISMLKICIALTKEKGFASFRHQVTMWTIRTMNTTVGFPPETFPITMPKICAALNKGKGIAIFKHPVPMWTIRTMI